MLDVKLLPVSTLNRLNSVSLLQFFYFHKPKSVHLKTSHTVILSPAYSKCSLGSRTRYDFAATVVVVVPLITCLCRTSFWHFRNVTKLKSHSICLSLSLFLSFLFVGSFFSFSLTFSFVNSLSFFLSFFLSFSFLILSVFLSSAFSCSFSFFYTLLSFFFLSYLSPYLIIHFCLTIWLSISLLISYLSFIGFTISYLTTLASFCLFSSFSQGNEKSSTTFVYKKHRWRAWDSNPGPQGGRRRRIHWAIAAPSLLFVRSSLNSPVSLSVHLSASPWPNVTVLRCRDKRRRCSSVVKLLMPDSQR